MYWELTLGRLVKGPLYISPSLHMLCVVLHRNAGKLYRVMIYDEIYREVRGGRTKETRVRALSILITRCLLLKFEFY